LDIVEGGYFANLMERDGTIFKIEIGKFLMGLRKGFPFKIDKLSRNLKKSLH